MRATEPIPRERLLQLRSGLPPSDDEQTDEPGPEGPGQSEGTSRIDAMTDPPPLGAVLGPSERASWMASTSPHVAKPLISTAEADALRPDDLLHPSRMTERFGLLVRLFATIFFKKVDFPARLGNAITTCAREGVPVYVMGTASLLDVLYLNDTLLRRQMPRAAFGNGSRMTAFQPWRLALRFWWRRLRGVPVRAPLDILSALLRRRQSALLFLRRPISFNPLPAGRIRADDMLRTLCATQRAMDVPIFLLPAVLIWERKGRDNDILDAFLGDPLAPGPLRKLFGFITNYRRAFVRGGEPVNLQAFLNEQGGADDDELSARLKALLQQRLEVEHRVISGVLVRPPSQVAEEIVGEAGFDATLQGIATEQKRPLAAVREEARANLVEIGADLRMWMIELFSLVLTFVWARIYEGLEVDEDGLQAIRESGRRGPVVIAPSHKSHIDYLIISYIFFRNGMVPPHIAAGANLSFFPLGWFFRKAGAFFLRRSFKGQPVYGASFRAYVRKLLADGHWLEFFIEGTRSRTGKLLPPRFGLLRMVVEAVASGDVEDVTIVPTNFGYERLIEEVAYRKELEGAEKKTESAGDLLKATRVLAHKYGRMRIQFSEPLSLRRLLDEELAGAPPSDLKAFDRAVKTIGYHIEAGINRAAVLTPTALVSTVMLTKIHRGIERSDLQLRVGYLLDSAVRRGAVLSGPLRSALAANRQRLQYASTRDQADRAIGVSIDPISGESARARALGESVSELIDGALTMIEEANWVFRKPFENGDVYVVKRDGRLHLDYYKNNLLHLFVPEALLATALLGCINAEGGADAEIVREDTKLLSRLLKLEFVYDPAQGFRAQYDDTLRRFCEAGWLEQRDGDRLQLADAARPVVAMYSKLIQNFVESYWIVGRSLVDLGDQAMTEPAFVAQCQKVADRLFELGEVQCYEAISKVNLGHALQIYLELGTVHVTVETQGKRSVRVMRVSRGEETAAPLAPTVHRLETFASLWRSSST